MTDNLTDSQRRLLAVLLPAVKREMVEIGDEIKAEIESCVRNKKRHEQGFMTPNWNVSSRRSSGRR